MKGLKNKIFKSVGQKQGGADKDVKPIKNLAAALAEDRKNETKDDTEQGRNWFHPHTKRTLAEQKLKEAGNKTGTFLVRESANTGNFVLSLVAGGELCHYNVNQVGQGSYHLGNVKSEVYRGIDQVVDIYKSEAKRLKAKLTNPCPGQAPPYESRAFGFTNLLHKAITGEDQTLALKILEHKDCPNINAKNNLGNTALHEACLTRQAKVVEKLLECGAKTNIQQLEGCTALMLCCGINAPDIIKILMEKGGADPQDSDVNTGNVALHKAAEKGHLDCVKMLLSLKAPAHPRNNKKRTPLDLARQNGHLDCINFIDDFKPFPAETTREEWFHGTLSKEEAEVIIKRHGWSDGLFLVRKSTTRKNLYILVLCYESYTYNYEIVNAENIAFYIDDGTVLPSLEHLVEFYCIRAEGLPSRLVKAIDPNDKVRPMKWLHGSRDRARGGPSPVSSYEAATNQRKKAEPYKLAPGSVKLGPELGEGEYGTVFRGTWTSETDVENLVAIKTLHMKHTAAARDNFLREAQVMVQLNHPCIVRLIGVCLEPSFMLVQELVVLGSMLDFMLDYPEKINKKTDLFLWAAQIAWGMTYLEENHIVHRDLAARNILLQSKKEAKVGDFGLSRDTSSQTDAYQASVGGRWPIKWYAPECVNFGTFSSKSDVWSYGITLWEMFTLGDQPYGDMTGGEVITMVERNGRLKKPAQCPDGVYNLMKLCWSYEPPNRPTFSELQEHFDTDPEIKRHMTIKGPYPGPSSQI